MKRRESSVLLRAFLHSDNGTERNSCGCYSCGCLITEERKSLHENGRGFIHPGEKTDRKNQIHRHTRSSKVNIYTGELHLKKKKSPWYCKVFLFTKERKLFRSVRTASEMSGGYPSWYVLAINNIYINLFHITSLLKT